MREKQFQALVVEAAGYLGWRVFHDFDSRRSTPGFPDLVLLRPPALLMLELKTERGRIRPEQEVWIAELDQVPGVTARIVRPSMWGEIESLLKGEAA